MPRRPLVAGNWKMHHLTQDAIRFAGRMPEATERWTDVDVALFPPATLLAVLARSLSGSRVRLGGQNCHAEREGAFTGELSAPMLADAGCSFVLVGHSERRTLFGEDDATVARKLHAALDAGLRPVLCVGESLAEREGGRTAEVLDRQLEAALSGVGADRAGQMVLAYEPVWAIGTGRTATPDLAQEAHAHLRSRLAERFGDDIAWSATLLYGGSVKPENFAELVAQPDVDGGLIGGASLEADSFVALIRAASGFGPRLA